MPLKQGITLSLNILWIKVIYGLSGMIKKKYYSGFGAGTSIKRREIGFHDSLEYRMKMQDDLRFKMIALAIRNKDFEMLDKLHARELPLLYTINPMHHWTLGNMQLPYSPNVKQMIESIAASENTAISYFFDAFETETESSASRSAFVFPYAGLVLDALITGKRSAESKRFLQKAIEHNMRVQKNLQKLINKSKAGCKELNSGVPHTENYDDVYYSREAWREYYFYPDTGFVAYCMPLFLKNATGFITNIISITASSNDTEIQFLIDELRKTYNNFIKQKKEA